MAHETTHIAALGGGDIFTSAARYTFNPTNTTALTGKTETTRSFTVHEDCVVTAVKYNSTALSKNYVDGAMTLLQGTLITFESQVDEITLSSGSIYVNYTR